MEERICSIIDTLKDELRGKTDLSDDSTPSGLNTAIDQLINILNMREDINFPDSLQKSLLYSLCKSLGLCIKSTGDQIMFNFSISYLCVQCIQNFLFSYPSCSKYLTIPLKDDEFPDKSINFLEVSKKFLNSQIPEMIFEFILNIIERIVNYRSVEVSKAIDIDIFFNLLDFCQNNNKKKIFTIIKQIVFNSEMDSTYSKYLDKFLDLTFVYFEQIRQNGVANKLIDLQIFILAKLLPENSNITDEIISFDYCNSIFQLIMKLILPLLNSNVTNTSQKAFKYDEERKLFQNLLSILSLFCNSKDSFNNLISLIHSPPEIETDSNSQYSQSSQISQIENSFDFSKILFIFRDNPVDVLRLLCRIYSGASKYLFESEKEFKEFMSKFSTNENLPDKVISMDLFDDDEKMNAIDTIATISKSIQPILINLAVSKIQNNDLFCVLTCFCHTLDYNVPLYSSIPNLFYFVLRGFAFNSSVFSFPSISIPQMPQVQNFPARYAGGFVQNNFGGGFAQNNFGGGFAQNNFGGGFAQNNFGRGFAQNNFGGGFAQNQFDGGFFQNNFGGGFFQNNFGGGFAQNQFGGGFAQNQFDRRRRNQVNGNHMVTRSQTKDSNNFKAFTYTNVNGSTENKKLVIKILLALGDKSVISDSFLIDILKPNRSENKNKSFMDFYNEFNQTVSDFNAEMNVPKYTKTNIANLSFTQIADLIAKEKISKVQFLKQGFVHHCIDLLKKIEKPEEEMINSAKILIQFCFELIKIIPISLNNFKGLFNTGELMNEYQSFIDYQYKYHSFHLNRFASLSMIEGLINLKEFGLNKNSLIEYANTKPEIMKLIKSKLENITFPSQFATYYRAFDHPEYKKKAIRVNGRVYSHMDSQYRVMAELRIFNIMNINCSSIDEDKAIKSEDSFGYSILTVPQMQVKNIIEFAEILDLLTKLHKVFVSDEHYSTFYKRQDENFINNYIDDNNNVDDNEVEDDDIEYRNEEENRNENHYSSEEESRSETQSQENDESQSLENDESQTLESDESENKKSETKDQEKDKDKEQENDEKQNDDANENNAVYLQLDDITDEDLKKYNFIDKSVDSRSNELSPLFINKDLRLIIHYLTTSYDVISLKSNSLSTILNYPFLFPFDIRATAIKLLLFPCKKSISLCEREFGCQNKDEDDEEIFQYDEQVIHLGVDRPSKDGDTDLFFNQGCEIMRRFAPNPEMFDIEFTGEKGIGKGPTHEFYTLFSRAFCEAKRKIFRNNSSGMEAEANAEAQIEAESQKPEVDFDLDDENEVDKPANSNSNSNAQDTSFADVKYCMDKLGMFPSYEADPAIYEVLGIFCAKAIFMECIVDIYFNPAFFKLCRNKPVSMSEVDPQLALSLSKKEDFIGNSWFEFIDRELVKGGANIEVTKSNVDKFVFLINDLIIGSGIEKCVDNFLKGFCQIMPFEALNIFSESEISHLLGGSKSVEITENDFENNIRYEYGYNKDSRAIVLFKDLIINDMNDSDRQRLIQFITGFNTLPIGGISSLKPKLTISKCLPPDVHFTKNTTLDERKEIQNKIDLMLPSVSTCTNKLRLPSYSSKEIMLQKLNYCMSESGGFQLI